jgi:hypothetical protein
MSKSESRVSSEILRAIGKIQRLKLFRNNMGVAWHKDGSVVRYGVGPKGAGDYLGWEEVVITPDMVGKKIARFTSTEFKDERGGRVAEEQLHWAKVVNAAGGRAVILSSAEQATAEFGRG